MDRRSRGFRLVLASARLTGTLRARHPLQASASQLAWVEVAEQSNYARTYDPSTGRYLEADPIGAIGLLELTDPTLGTLQLVGLQGRDRFGLFAPSDVDLYGYALSNPVNRVDPSGLVSATFQFGAGIAFRFTFGFDNNGDTFFELGGGLGGGLSLTIDPAGGPLAAECDLGDEPTVGISLLGEAGFGLGPIGPGATAFGSASGVLNTPACGCASAGLSKSLVARPSKFGIGSSLTLNGVFFRGNHLPQIPSRRR